MDENKKTKKMDKNKNMKKRFKSRAEIRVERFIIEEIDRYIKLHKEHEKDLKYIG